MKKDYAKFLVFAALLILGFGIAILALSWPLLTGKAYVLATAPVDPFDAFRGQYINIRYEITTLNATLLSNLAVSESDAGKYIYIILKKDDSAIYRPENVSFEIPRDEDFIRGKISDVRGNSAIVEYGIEQFFFESGAGFSVRNITIELKVSDSGQARISKILQDGKPLDIKYKEVKITA